MIFRACTDIAGIIIIVVSATLRCCNNITKFSFTGIAALLFRMCYDKLKYVLNIDVCQWCSLRDMQVYTIGKVKDLHIPT